MNVSIMGKEMRIYLGWESHQRDLTTKAVGNNYMSRIVYYVSQISFFHVSLVLGHGLTVWQGWARWIVMQKFNKVFMHECCSAVATGEIYLDKGYMQLLLAILPNTFYFLFLWWFKNSTAFITCTLTLHLASLLNYFPSSNGIFINTIGFLIILS